MENDFRIVIRAPINSSLAWDAITKQLSSWWGGEISGNYAGLNDEFTIRFGKTSKTFRVTGFEAGKLITWTVLKAYIDADRLKEEERSEWEGQELHWSFDEQDGQTSVQLLQVGLRPGIACYELCSNAWTFFIKESLYDFLTKGTGKPYALKPEKV
ncbi:hypothetical protein COR50_16990 [Chitinophaga caeni]|uniref:ATPase n=1 Tax=Chitinophaga caeni TaxID=2029983 RepID=A0A291QXW6_9BACT|nr:hypothetical protein [Chitinophaga caeni]ATL48722.1 hypothetical protein COR50_16990 [Chitinophaga caeni]